MDDSDKATEQEYSLLRHVSQAGDTQSTVCHGCSYATRKSWGHSCESWSDCLKDAARLGIVA